MLILQLAGNGILIFIFGFKLRDDLSASATIVLSLAVSDFISGLNGTIGIYRDDLGRTEFYWPMIFNLIYCYLETVTSGVTSGVVASFAFIRNEQ